MNMSRGLRWKHYMIRVCRINLTSPHCQLSNECCFSLHIDPCLTIDVQDTIAMFCFVSSGNFSRNAYNRMLQLLGHRLPSHTYHMLLQEISKLAHVEQEIYDCCINSCCAYTGDLGPLEQCPHCKEVWFDKWKHPCQQFWYTPLTPRLQSLFLNQKLADTMDYRANYDLSSSNISYVFDSQHYCSLLSQQVIINNVLQGHQFFSERWDIALGYMTDGFQIFKRQERWCNMLANNHDQL